MMTLKQYVVHMTHKWQHTTKLKIHMQKVVNGVIMGGLTDKWRFFRRKKIHGTNCKKQITIKTIVVDLV